MFERDYLMRMLMAFYEAITRSVRRAEDDDDPQEAADLLDEAVGNAVDMDGKALLSLAPESIAGVMRISGVDPRVSEYVARSLLLSSQYLAQAGQTALSGVRAAQARAIAEAYAIDLPENPADISDLRDLAESEQPVATGAGSQSDAGGSDSCAEDAGSAGLGK